MKHFPYQVHDCRSQCGKQDDSSVQCYIKEGDYPRKKCNAGVAEENVAGNGDALAVVGCHAEDDGKDNNHDDEFSARCAENSEGGILHAYHKYDDRGESGKQYESTHSFAVKDEDQRREDQGGACFVLQEDEDNRQYNNGSRLQVIALLRVEREAVGPEQFGQSQCGREFGKFSGLETDRSKHNPRMRPFDVGGYEYG